MKASKPIDHSFGVLSCLHVLDNERVVQVVCRDRDGDWLFLCGDDHGDDGPEAFEIVGVEHLLERQDELRALLDLEIGWMAEARNGRWVRSALK
jgi:hypothetical protein